MDPVHLFECGYRFVSDQVDRDFAGFIHIDDALTESSQPAIGWVPGRDSKTIQIVFVLNTIAVYIRIQIGDQCIEIINSPFFIKHSILQAFYRNAVRFCKIGIEEYAIGV